MSCKPVLLTMKINFDAAAIRWAMSPHFLLCIFGERFDIHFHFSIATPKFWCSSNQMSHVATIFFDARFHFKQKQLLMQLSWSIGPFINDVTLIWPGFDPIDYAVLEVLPLFFGHVKVTSPGPKWSVFLNGIQMAAILSKHLKTRQNGQVFKWGLVPISGNQMFSIQIPTGQLNTGHFCRSN